MLRSILALGAGLAILAACDQLSGSWQAWVYPNPDDERVAISLAGFRTFEQCQQAAIGELRRQPDPDKAGYKCGRSCRWDEASRTNVCKEIRR